MDTTTEKARWTVSQDIIAAKFGGTSVKDAQRILHIRDRIVRPNSARRVIVVSAAAGVTNMLIEWVESFIDSSLPGKESVIYAVEAQYEKTARKLGLLLDIPAMFREIWATCVKLRARGMRKELYNYAVSRGEWVNAQIVAEVLGYEFVDSQRFIVLDKNGRCMLDATKRHAERIGLLEKARHGIVVGGFYGRGTSGLWPLLFSRGGSDITGAILAVLVGAKVYENWTDVAGIFAADPRIVKDPRKNDEMTFKELRELTFMGFKVFHEDAVAFVREANIPIHVRCTMTPQVSGTMIRKGVGRKRHRVTGVAGKNGFSMVVIEKYGMNDERGIQSRIERAFTGCGLSVNTIPSIDSVTVVVETKQFTGPKSAILARLKQLRPDSIQVEDDIALICTVGEGMRGHIGMSSMVDAALARGKIEHLLESLGGSKINIMRAVSEKDRCAAINAIYRKFFNQGRPS
ncbi:aspartate kinase [Candidatus Kaiserbacteria bacterium]|nr:aspartate kinase [Candidatus Kaiserbacteria bacterium]